MSARPEPRSDFVIKCSAEHVQEALGHEPRRCAGSAFEVLVHLFWREAAANKQKVELSLQGAKVEVDCAEFQKRPKSIKEYEEAVAVDKDLVGYFKSDSPRYPVLDSILRFKLADKTEVLAIQISTARQHKRSNPCQSCCFFRLRQPSRSWPYGTFTQTSLASGIPKSLSTGICCMLAATFNERTRGR